MQNVYDARFERLREQKLVELQHVISLHEANHKSHAANVRNLNSLIMDMHVRILNLKWYERLERQANPANSYEAQAKQIATAVGYIEVFLKSESSKMQTTQHEIKQLNEETERVKRQGQGHIVTT